jgi:argininosuccinate lyase
VKDCLAVFADMMAGVRPVPERMRAAALEGYSTATDLADYLVGKGVPFRDAHEIVARAVRAAEELNCDLSELPLATLRGFSRRIQADVADWLTLEASVSRRSHVGGTAPKQVLRAVARARKRLARP